MKKPVLAGTQLKESIQFTEKLDTQAYFVMSASLMGQLSLRESLRMSALSVQTQP